MMTSADSSTRSKILAACWAQLEAGGNAVRMADIARAAKVSRQAVYLHFANRAELLIATTKYIDEVKGADDRLIESRTSTNGPQRLMAFIEAWGNYIPEIYAVAHALITMGEQDEAAKNAWAERMAALRHGCAAAIEALKRDQTLRHDLTETEATDIMWTLLSVENWQSLRQRCQWSQEKYITHMKRIAEVSLMEGVR